MGELKDYQRSRFSLFTQLQRQAVVAFLEALDNPEGLLTPWRRVANEDDGLWFRRFY